MQGFCSAFWIVVNKVPFGSKPTQNQSRIALNWETAEMCNCLEPQGASAGELLWPILALELVCFTDFVEPICTSDEGMKKAALTAKGAPFLFNGSSRH